jgi:hypothetical protein
MKKIFTLFAMGAFVLVGKKSQSQINENFENGLTSLTANCWKISDVFYATTPSAYVINGSGTLYTEPPVNSATMRNVGTPVLTVGNTITISFNYRLSDNLNGQATRTVQIDLADDLLATVETLASFNVPGNATSTTSFSQTFNVTTPGSYRVVIRMGGYAGAGNVRFSFDDLYVSAPAEPCLTSAPLAVKLTGFQGNLNNGKVTLNWSVASNETTDRFEVERSVNGKDFTTAGLVFTSEKMGSESYMFYENISGGNKIYYRLKMYDKAGVINYSKIIVFTLQAGKQNGIKILSNPAMDKLTFSFHSSISQAVSINIYDVSGRLSMTQKISVYQGVNALSVPLNNNFKTGMYIMEVTDGATSQSAKFIKQ